MSSLRHATKRVALGLVFFVWYRHDQKRKY